MSRNTESEQPVPTLGKQKKAPTTAHPTTTLHCSAFNSPVSCQLSLPTRLSNSTCPGKRCSNIEVRSFPAVGGGAAQQPSRPLLPARCAEDPTVRRPHSPATPQPGCLAPPWRPKPTRQGVPRDLDQPLAPARPPLSRLPFWLCLGSLPRALGVRSLGDLRPGRDANSLSRRPANSLLRRPAASRVLIGRTG